jgi:hypothetical protein
VLKIAIHHPLNGHSRGKSEESTDIPRECLYVQGEVQIEGYEIHRVGTIPIAPACDKLRMFRKKLVSSSERLEHGSTLASVQLSDNLFLFGESRFHNAEICGRGQFPRPRQPIFVMELLIVVSRPIDMENGTARL